METPGRFFWVIVDKHIGVTTETGQSRADAEDLSVSIHLTCPTSGALSSTDRTRARHVTTGKQKGKTKKPLKACSF